MKDAPRTLRAFRFPFADDLGEDQRSSLADLLLDLPLTTVLFLKHLERVEVEIRKQARQSPGKWIELRSAKFC